MYSIQVVAQYRYGVGCAVPWQTKSGGRWSYVTCLSWNTQIYDRTCRRCTPDAHLPHKSSRSSQCVLDSFWHNIWLGLACQVFLVLCGLSLIIYMRNFSGYLRVMIMSDIQYVSLHLGRAETTLVRGGPCYKISMVPIGFSAGDSKIYSIIFWRAKIASVVKVRNVAWKFELVLAVVGKTKETLCIVWSV